MANNDGKALYDKTIEIDPRNIDAWIGKGVALYNLGMCNVVLRKLSQDHPSQHRP